MLIPITTVPFVDEHGILHSAEFAYDDTYAGHFSISYAHQGSTISIEHFLEGKIWAVDKRYSHSEGNPALAADLLLLIAAFRQANPELFI